MQLPKTSIHARDLKFSDDLAGVKTTPGPVSAFDLEKSRNTPPPIPYRPSKTPTSCKLIGVDYSIAFPENLLSSFRGFSFFMPFADYAQAAAPDAF